MGSDDFSHIEFADYPSGHMINLNTGTLKQFKENARRSNVEMLAGTSPSGS
jgi:hypothetical protein